MAPPILVEGIDSTLFGGGRAISAQQVDALQVHATFDKKQNSL